MGRTTPSAESRVTIRDRIAVIAQEVSPPVRKQLGEIKSRHRDGSQRKEKTGSETESEEKIGKERIIRHRTQQHCWPIKAVVGDGNVGPCRVDTCSIRPSALCT